MYHLQGTLCRSFRLLAWGLFAVTSAMAQLDHRLQSTNTDFLDLYQQSSNELPKPEIVSIFDFSRSMASLMFHPLYQNFDVSDADDYRYMKFVLTAPKAPNNSWVLYARAGNDSNAYARVLITINPDSTASILQYHGEPVFSCKTVSGTSNGLCGTAPSYYYEVEAKGNVAAKGRVTWTPLSSTTPHTNYVPTTSSTGSQGPPPYTVTMAVSPVQPSYAPGSLVTMTATLNHAFVEGEDPNHKQMTWVGRYGFDYEVGSSWSEVIPALVYQSTTTVQIPDWVAQDKTQLATIEYRVGGGGWTTGPSSPIPANSTVEFRTYFQVQGNGTDYDKIEWSVNNQFSTAGCLPGTLAVAGTPSTAGTSQASAGTVSITLPSYCSTAIYNLKPYSVAVSLDARISSAYDARGNYASGVGYAYPGELTADTNSSAGYEALRKPDGSAVTMQDAVNASGGLVGTERGAADIRNWIRAASHVRLSKAVGGQTRTIDLPIPWKIMDRESTGSPLSSSTLLDRQVKTMAGTTTSFGSGQQIELDTNYKIDTVANGILAADTSGAVIPANSSPTAYLYGVLYRPAYIAWLFSAKYQQTDATKANYTEDSSLSGKFIAFDSLNASLAGGQTSLSWGQGFGPSGTAWGTMNVPKYNQDGTYASTGLEEASKYRTPSITRIQAMKQAAIQTWIGHQTDVYWAFRCLDPANEASAGTATDISNNSATTLNAGLPSASHVDGLDSGWTVLNNTQAQGTDSTTGNSVTGMARIAGLFASGSTPLTYAMARTLAQYSDPLSVFNAVEGPNVTQCSNPFLLLFTDGLDNNGKPDLSLNTNSTTPYLTGSDASQSLNILGGNQAILGTPININRGGSYWNLFTMAGIAAHLSDASLGTKNYMAAPDPGTSRVSGPPSFFLPFAIKKRNGVTYGRDHRVTTMTVGVSMAGRYTEAASPKRGLFLAAALGDPAITSGVLSTFHSFNGWAQSASETLDPTNDWIPDPTDPGSYPTVGMRKTGAVYFFDATDKDKLATSMDFAFRIAIGTAGNQATSNPNIPFVGASHGKQLYIGKFMPPSIGGVLWPGDLLMFGLSEVNGNLQVMDNTGAVASSLTAATAQWSASAALASGPVGTARRLFTRIPRGTSLQSFTETGSGFTDVTTGLKNFVATANADPTAKQTIIQFAAGGDTSVLGSNGKPTANRSNILGDIINSAPAALEYSWADIGGRLGGFPNINNMSGTRRFRLVLVGTNQGWLHGFGEVTQVNASGAVLQSAVQELWSFMPTDFLAKLDYLTVPTNVHRSMVDGSPVVYHLDRPGSSGGPGNGTVDSGERAMVIIGLGKGGRSYYALDIKDPLNPTLAWSWVPDEAATFSSDRIATGGPVLATVQGILQKAGFATSTPAIGRVLDGAGVLRDAVFLGGGFSVPEVEANFRDASDQPMLLGRSATALDVSSGKVLAALDLSTDAAVSNPLAVGPVAAGVVPFEFVLNSGMAQRAYFTDYRGGLWVWGSKAVSSAAPYTDFRQDTSRLQNWTLRKVYQDNNANRGARYTTLPAPFRVGTFPGVGKAGSTTPAAVGVALISGDRNNPLDRSYSDISIPPNLAPTRHRLTVVFDRQDSRAWELDTANGPDTGITTIQLKNFTDNSVSETPAIPCASEVFKYITQGCADYYLAPYQSNGSGSNTALPPSFGYYINLPVSSDGLIPKGINPPLVVAGSLFYSYFTPTLSDPCTGGAGVTTTSAIYDVLNPIATDTRAGLSFNSGAYATWVGVASNLVSLGGRGVLQGGMKATVNSLGVTTSTTTLATTPLAAPQRFPKPLVWRTVH